MNKRDHKELERYCRWVANEVGLRDWTLYVDIETDLGGRGDRSWGASNHPVAGRKAAILRFHPDRRKDSLEEFRHYVVHELVHLHFFSMWDTLIRDLPPILEELAPGKKRNALRQALYDSYLNGVERQMEYGVDAVAEAICPRIPLIEWPKR